jgi:hypothetical protein
METFVTFVGMGTGLGTFLFVFFRLPADSADKWPIVVMLGIGAFLVVGSQYAKFIVSEKGIEVVRKEVKENAEATVKIADTLKETADAVKAAHAQIDALLDHVEDDRPLSAKAGNRFMDWQSKAAAIDTGRLGEAKQQLVDLAR